MGNTNKPGPLVLQLLAPYLAVALCWCWLHHAWLTILVYHTQMVFWLYQSPPSLMWPSRKRWLVAALPAMLAGPLAYALLPVLSQQPFPAWLEYYHLTGPALLLLIPYFGLVHPVLEQVYWAPLRHRTRWAHPLFAGYHMLVLGTLLNMYWLALVFILLTVTSWIWMKMETRSRSLLVPIASHVLADLGLILAAWMRG